MRPYILNSFFEGASVIYLSCTQHLTVKTADQCLTDFAPVFAVNFKYYQIIFLIKPITNFELICCYKIGRYLFKVYDKDTTAIDTYYLQLF